MSSGASKQTCSFEAEETLIGREVEDGEDSPGRELAPDLGFLLRPPRLEDAGLEDCALPPESIQEAFSIAAKSLELKLALANYSEDDEDEGNIEGDAFGTGAEVRTPESGNDATIDWKGTSGRGARGRGGSFSQEKALGPYVIPGNGCTGTGTEGEQTEQLAGSDEAFGICSRTVKS